MGLIFSKKKIGCKHILLSGKRKGQVCNKLPVNDQGYCNNCKRNYVKIIKTNESIDTIPEKKKVQKRKSIPKKVREDVWIKYNGESYKGRCYCCHDEISIIAFHCGHIIPASKGGTDIVDNLVPLCINCNLSMNDKNLYDYMKIYYPKNISK